MESKEVIMIYDSFENLDDVKKQAIINAGFKSFGENGYKKTSVEQIVKEAGISKGSLFYYFQSKKNFYMYLFDYCASQMERRIDVPGEDGIPTYMQKTDFFERLREIQLLKAKFSKDYPHVYSFMKSVIFEASPVVHGEIQNISNNIIKERTMEFYYNLDTYKFKDGIDPKMVLQLLTWCSEGCANQLLIKQKRRSSHNQTEDDFKEIIGVYNTYVELLRTNFYKEEYL